MLGMGLFDECIRLINQWHPKKKYPQETKYRDDLMDFLHEKLNQSSGIIMGDRNVLVKKESGRGLCDIAVGDRKVGIELKRNLKSKSQINRLQGQIDDYEEDYEEGVIVVLVGKTDKFAETTLKHKLDKKSRESVGFGLNQFRIEIITKQDKGISNKAKNKNSFLSDPNKLIPKW